MVIRFYGYSDDLVEVESDNGSVDQEHGEWSPGAGIFMSFNVGDRLIVHAIYDEHGWWSFAVSPNCDGVEDECNVAVPRWPITTVRSRECRHSMELRIEAPDGTQVTRVDRNVTYAG